MDAYRRRLVDLYTIPFIIAVVASAIWWAITEDIFLGVAALVGTLALTTIAWFALPFLRRLQRARSSEILQVFINQAAATADMHAALGSANRIDILTVRGLGILALNDSALRKQVLGLSDRQLRIRVLVLDPTCDASVKRAAEVGESLDAFVHGINLGVERLRQLGTNPLHSIEVYAYDSIPAWRAIVINDVFYVSAFGAHVEGHQSTLYKIDALRNSTLGTAMQRMMENMFDTGRKIV